MEERRVEISFGGCGFLAVYHAGVGKCVVDHAPFYLDELQGFYGASSGAITAVCAACKCDPMIPYKWVKKTFEASRKYRVLGMFHPSFELYTRLKVFLEDFLPKDAHRLTRGKVKISLTTIERGKLKNWIVSNFNTRMELINAIVASSFVPVYAGFKFLPLFRGKRCFDGGFTSNIPFAADPNVITVSPFSGDIDICPQGDCQSYHMFNLGGYVVPISSQNMIRMSRALIPRKWAELEDLFFLGYEDTLRFFKTEGIVPVVPLRPIRRNSSVVQLPPSSTAAPELLSDLVEVSSDYFSLSGDEPSCADEQENSERAEFVAYTTSLEEELEQLELDDLADRMAGRDSSPGYLQASWQRLTWLAQVPTRVPLIGGVFKAVGMATNKLACPHMQKAGECVGGPMKPDACSKPGTNKLLTLFSCQCCRVYIVFTVLFIILFSVFMFII